MAELWALVLGLARGAAILAAALWVGGYLRGLAHAWLETRVDPTWRGILAQFVRFLPAVLVMQTVLEGVGIPSTSYIAGVSAAGLAIALSLRDSLSNAASGAILLTTTPFRAGDAVTVAGVTGTVRRVGFLTTELVTEDGRMVTLTNDRVFGANIERHAQAGRTRVELSVRLHPRHVEPALLRALESAAAGAGDAAEPAPVQVVELDEVAGARLLVRAWCDAERVAATREALSLAVAACLRAHLPPDPR